MIDAKIHIESANLGYNGIDLIQQVNICIRAGEICLIHGPNGSGKTTLGVSLLGILPLRSGQIHNSFQKLGYVPQVNRLDRQYPLALRDVVSMGLPEVFTLNTWRRWQRSAAVRKKVDQVLESVGLLKQGGLHFSEASGGQLQRALIGRALISEPDFILLDEPFSNLDQEGRRQVREILSQENQGRRVALVIIDHLRDDEKFYHRFFQIGDGRIVESKEDRRYVR